ncbi:EthD family reductase [uncultured Sulfitobacter sp.]|uniref:EthD family reductase n=1 Tax=uncultured Sulfitobacter sp. TaxID=191468 RepID=UPI00261A1DEF|nr:EthD family reductase [uncultured Sulfitobacter sp.]
MSFTWFATFQNDTGPGAEIAQAELEAVNAIVAGTPGLSSGLIYTPWAVDGLPFDDGPPPRLQLQLYFEHIEDLENALRAGGPLQALADPDALPSLAKGPVTEQAMLARDFAGSQGPDVSGTFCTFLVHYPGPAEDLNHWLQHYIAHHTPVMRRFPGIRGVEVCSRLDWCSALPWERVHHMQRNKVVFDDAEALKAALASPVLAEMRADSGSFPAYAGGNAHYPMRTVHVHGTTPRTP